MDVIYRGHPLKRLEWCLFLLFFSKICYLFWTFMTLQKIKIKLNCTHCKTDQKISGLLFFLFLKLVQIDCNCRECTYIFFTCNIFNVGIPINITIVDILMNFQNTKRTGIVYVLKICFQNIRKRQVALSVWSYYSSGVCKLSFRGKGHDIPQLRNTHIRLVLDESGI